jgi:poly(3-hydroxybutyrate) depolymerase
MKFLRTMVPLTLLVLLAGCAVPQDQNTPVPHFSEIDPTTGRLYYIYVPSTYRHDRPCPLIVTCHGTPPYDVADMHIREWKMLAERNGCIAIAPTLIATDGLLGDGPVVGMLSDERYILSIIGRLSYRFNIDRANIMITGFSGGGFPTYWVGLRHPDIFSTVVARSCDFNQPNLEGWYSRDAKNTAIMVFYGENDPPTIRAQSQDAIAYLRSQGFTVATRVIPGIGHERRPEVAMDFFRKHWRAPQPTATP